MATIQKQSVGPLAQWTRKAVVRGDEMKDEVREVCVLLLQLLELRIVRSMSQRAEFVPVAAQHRLIDGAARFGEWPINVELLRITLRLEGSLPA